MFGDKNVKKERLARLKAILAQRELGATELARELGVSRHAILYDIDAIDKQEGIICENKGKFSLLQFWYGNTKRKR